MVAFLFFPLSYTFHMCELACPKNLDLKHTFHPPLVESFFSRELLIQMQNYVNLIIWWWWWWIVIHHNIIKNKFWPIYYGRKPSYWAKILRIQKIDKKTIHIIRNNDRCKPIYRNFEAHYGYIQMIWYIRYTL